MTPKSEIRTILVGDEAQPIREFRIRKAFAVVQFEQPGKGRIVFLPEGAELRVIGPSCVCECFEVRCKNLLYNIFKADLLGPWSNPIRCNPMKPRPINLGAAVAACA
jgi:hypothetical protein